MSNFQKPLNGVEKPGLFHGYRKKDSNIKHERLLFIFSNSPKIEVGGKQYILIDLWWGNRLNKNYPVPVERFEEDYEVVQIKGAPQLQTTMGGNRGN